MINGQSRKRMPVNVRTERLPRERPALTAPVEPFAGKGLEDQNPKFVAPARGLLPILMLD